MVVGAIMASAELTGCVLLPAAAIVGGTAAGAAGAGAVAGSVDNCVPPWEMHEWDSKMAIEWGIREPCPEGSTTPPPFLKGTETPEKPKKSASGQ